MNLKNLASKQRLSTYSSPDVDLIAAPWGFGGTDNLAQEGAYSILEKGLAQRLEALGIKVSSPETESLGPFEIFSEENRIRNIEAILQINNWVSQKTSEATKKNSIPIMLGGDASLSIGSVKGIAEVKKSQGVKLGILWLSNHLNNSSPEVTKSWNANRMAFHALSYEGKPEDLHQDFEAMMRTEPSLKKFPDLPIVNKDAVVHVGISHKSPQSKVESSYYTMSDVEEIGAKQLISEVIDELSTKCDQVHLIWDLNCLDLSGVSNYSLGQLTYREAVAIARIIDIKLRRENKLSSIDVVEYCPSREAWDKRGEAAYWMIDILSNIFGENIFNVLRKY